MDESERQVRNLIAILVNLGIAPTKVTEWGLDDCHVVGHFYAYIREYPERYIEKYEKEMNG